MSETIDIAKIRRDGGTQSRVYTDSQTVESYVEAMRGGTEFPPITVFFDGENYWLADGFHRVQAAQRLDRKEIAADVIQGTQRDAILYSAGANATHGLRRTNEDKRRAVLRLLNDAEWVQWSNREISRRTGVTDVTVGNIRKQLENEQKLQAQQTRIGADGRAMNTGNIGAKEEKPVFNDIFRKWRDARTETPLVQLPSGHYAVISGWYSKDNGVFDEFHVRTSYLDLKETEHWAARFTHIILFDQAFVDDISTKIPSQCLTLDDLPTEIRAAYEQIQITDRLNTFEARVRADYFQPGQFVVRIKDDEDTEDEFGIIKNFKQRQGYWNVEMMENNEKYPNGDAFGYHQDVLKAVDSTPTPETAETERDILALMEQLWKNEPNEAAFKHSFMRIGEQCYKMIRLKKGKSS